MTNISHKSVLVVDDDERLLRALDKVLTGEGARVTCSSWAGGVIDILSEQKKHVDLIIIDLCMPFVTGMTAVQVIHSHYPKLPIIVLTAFGSPDVKAECLSRGAVAFLEKPIESHALLGEINKVFSSPSESANRIALNKNMAAGKSGGKHSRRENY